MPILFHTRHEAFAVAHAQGACRVDAYRAAGYKGGPKNAPKIAKLPRVAARVAELRGQWGDSVDLAPVIDAMVRLALTADVSTAAGLNAARGLLAEAAKLKMKMAEQGYGEDEYEDIPPRVSQEEWVRRYAPPLTSP